LPNTTDVDRNENSEFTANWAYILRHTSQEAIYAFIDIKYNA